MSQTAKIKPGQYAGVMPDMSEEEFAALKQSIDEDGLKHPIEITPDGEIVDGHHRYKACRELGIEPETTVVEDATVEQAIRANFTRRNLSEGAKKDVVLEYLEDHYDGDRTQAEISEALGVSQPTVSRAMSDYSTNNVQSEESEEEDLSREERRERVADYLERNPDASNAEVARNVNADVSRETVRRWRKEWEDPDESPDEDTTDDDPDENSSDTGSTGDVVDELDGPATEDGDDETGDSSEPANNSETESTGADASDTGNEESASDDPAASEQPHPSDEADSPLQQALVKVDQLKEEKEQLQSKLLDAADRPSQSEVNTLRDDAAQALEYVEYASDELEPNQNGQITDRELQEARAKLDDAKAELEKVVA